MITVERHPVHGHLILSTIHNGRLITRQYYGYTQREAKAKFNQELKEIK